MKDLAEWILAAVVLASLAACSSSGTGGATAEDGGAKTPDAGDASVDPAALAADAFVWGYPLVVSERTFQTLGGVLGANQLFNQTALTDANLRFIVSPNQDTLYSVATLDVSREPALLTVPDVTDRYWTYQFLDAYTNSFHYIGTRATNGRGGTFAVAAPGFDGELPAEAEHIESPTPQLFLLGRYLVRGARDIPEVTALPRTLESLSERAGSTTPEPAPDLGAPKGTPQAVGDDGAVFFDELGDALARNPPSTDEDRAELARFASLGIGPGLRPTEGAGEAIEAALEAGVTAGAARIAAAAANAEVVNGWTVHLDIGVYDDALLRAVIAKVAWGANVPEESVYPISFADAQGEPYTGTRRYRMHFDAGALPPVEAGGFWSLTLYGPDRFFADNAIKRFAIGDRTEGLVTNPDGSVDLYVQHDAPAGHESNWLPAPEGEFSLMLRVYLPGEAALSGEYEYPPVTPEP
jgi:hypothetical protein